MERIANRYAKQRVWPDLAGGLPPDEFGMGGPEKKQTIPKAIGTKDFFICIGAIPLRLEVKGNGQDVKKSFGLIIFVLETNYG